MRTRTNHLAEETINFESLCFLLEDGFEIEAEADEAEIDEFGDPLEQLLLREELQGKTRLMTAKNEPRSLGKVHRSKV